MKQNQPQEINLRIILESPTPGVDIGLQKGHGNNYETVQTQRSRGKDLVFVFSARLKASGDGTSLLGPFVQGPTGDRFVYLDIGTYAGQTDSEWSRRLKIPLSGLTRKIIVQSIKDPEYILESKVPGRGKDGGPNCATVKPFSGWKLTRR